jgi:hypothetical protein
MPIFSYEYLFSQTNFLFVHEAYIEPKNAQYHNFLCQILAITYLNDYPELFTHNMTHELLQQIQQSSQTQKEKLINKAILKKNIQLVDFQEYALDYIVLATLNKPTDKQFYYCLCPINWLENDSPVKKIILENFDIVEILTSWQDAFFYAASSQRIIVKFRKKKIVTQNPNLKKSQKTKTDIADKATENYVYFTNVYSFENIETYYTNIPSIEKFTKTTEHIAFYTQPTHTTWAVDTNLLLKDYQKNWAKFLKMNSLYGTILAKCRYMLTPFRNMVAFQMPFEFSNPACYPLLPLQQNAKTTTVMNYTDNTFEIEKKYLRHVISTTKELALAQETEEKVGQLAFYCSKNKAELLKLNDNFAYQFIEKIEENSEKNENDNRQESHKKEIAWQKTKHQIADTLFSTQMIDSFLWIENNENYLHTHDIIGINWKKETLKYFLRSNFWHFWVENELVIPNSENNYLSIEKLSEILLVNADLLQKENIANAYQTLLKRKKLSLIDELTQPDTQELDACIADALGLETDVLTALYEQLSQLYTQRQDIESVAKKHKNQKQFLKIVETYLTQTTQEDSFSQKDFATFVEKNELSQDFITYNRGQKPIKILDFLGNYEIYAGEKLLLTTTSNITADFVKMYSLSEKETIQVFNHEDVMLQLITDFKQKIANKHFSTQKFMTNKFIVLR